MSLSRHLRNYPYDRFEPTVFQLIIRMLVPKVEYMELLFRDFSAGATIIPEEEHNLHEEEHDLPEEEHDLPEEGR